MMDYLENGNIVNSVNFPNCDMGICTKASRIAILHGNIPNSLSRFPSIISAEGINIENLSNSAKGDFAYMIIDTDNDVTDESIEDLKAIEGMIAVRKI